MKIKCKCGKEIELINFVNVNWFVRGNPIKCPKCGKDVYYKKGE